MTGYRSKQPTCQAQSHDQRDQHWTQPCLCDSCDRFSSPVVKRHPLVVISSDIEYIPSRRRKAFPPLPPADGLIHCSVPSAWNMGLPPSARRIPLFKNVLLEMAPGPTPDGCQLQHTDGLLMPSGRPEASWLRTYLPSSYVHSVRNSDDTGTTIPHCCPPVLKSFPPPGSHRACRSDPLP